MCPLPGLQGQTARTRAQEQQHRVEKGGGAEEGCTPAAATTTTAPTSVSTQWRRAGPRARRRRQQPHNGRGAAFRPGGWSAPSRAVAPGRGGKKINERVSLVTLRWAGVCRCPPHEHARAACDGDQQPAAAQAHGGHSGELWRTS